MQEANARIVMSFVAGVWTGRGVQCQVAEATTTGGNGERRELRMETSVEVEVLVMMVAG
jgi:hypothetical protein